jgi:methylated-DNA-[protein]-cysteine S-methyltransferase
LGITFGTLTETPLGEISFYAGDNGLRRVAFTTLDVLKKTDDIEEIRPSLTGLETIGILLTELNEYLFGIRKSFSVKIDLTSIGEFQRQVLNMTAEIPYGQVRTYGELAKELGKPGASRAVGSALGSNPMPIVIPCHRVIGADGGLRGYTDGIQTKAFLLSLEGHVVESGKVTKVLEH